MDNKKIVEDNVLSIANKVLTAWHVKLNNALVTVSPLFVNRNNNEMNYFSEIEFNFWKSSSLQTCFAIIIFMNNELVVNVNDVEKYINDEMAISYDEVLMSGKGNT